MKEIKLIVIILLIAPFALISQSNSPIQLGSKKISTEEFLKTYENIPNELVQQTYLKRDHCAFTDAQKIATIDAYNSFILNYPKALDIPLAIKMRNALAFEQTKKKDDILSYTNFIKTYPDAVEVESAKKRIHEIAFEETKSKNTLSIP